MTVKHPLFDDPSRCADARSCTAADCAERASCQAGQRLPKLQASRRGFLKATAAAAAALSLARCGKDVFQGRFSELSKAEVKEIISGLEREYRKKYPVNRKGKQLITVTAEPPQPGVVFGYGLDLTRCIGCRTCVHACVDENNQSRKPQIQWIKVLELEKRRGVDLMHSDPYYNPPKVPEPGKYYLPVACQQCSNPPCTRVCPVKATWKEKDGIVVVDYNWCIGCRYCVVACPYGARHFNWAEPTVPEEEIEPNMHYLGNRPRMKGVVEKCTFCIQRVRAPVDQRTGKPAAERDQNIPGKGRYPACVEACPVGARKFGNLLDPKSEIRYILENKRVLVLKEELNTRPKFYYFYAT
ncbi:MAG: 4Fe-4S dicluster domain-containing protein [bacterium]